jgi:hypothetical protein
MSLGGNVRLVISGAAPLPVHVEDFLRVVTCAPVVQGYGMISPIFCSLCGSMARRVLLIQCQCLSLHIVQEYTMILPMNRTLKTVL